MRYTRPCKITYKKEKEFGEGFMKNKQTQATTLKTLAQFPILSEMELKDTIGGDGRYNFRLNVFGGSGKK